jgi:holliday junction DNA helicase RuvA
MYTQVKGEVLSNKLFNLEIGLPSGMTVRVLTPMRVSEEIAKTKPSIVTVHVYTVYKEDNIVLYGFLERTERDLFEFVLNTVDGVGPKTGLALMNKFAPAEFIDMVSTANIALLSKCPGIGPKLAEKILFALKDRTLHLAKLVGSPSKAGMITSKYEEEAVQALTVLGLGEVTAKKKVAELLKANPAATTEMLVKDALKT